MSEQIARTFINVLIAIELSDESFVSDEAASMIMEDVSTSMSAASAEDRKNLVRLIEKMANEPVRPQVRDALRDLPEGLDLLDVELE